MFKFIVAVVVGGLYPFLLVAELLERKDGFQIAFEGKPGEMGNPEVLAVLTGPMNCVEMA